MKKLRDHVGDNAILTRKLLCVGLVDCPTSELLK